MANELTPSGEGVGAEPAAWPIETDDQVEALAKQCDWDNRRYMTPADYAIWCDRMRKFASLASAPATTSTPQPLSGMEGALREALRPCGVVMATPCGELSVSSVASEPSGCGSAAQA